MSRNSIVIGGALITSMLVLSLGIIVASPQDQAKSDPSLYFDGTTADYVDCGAHSLTGTFTVQLWFNPSGNTYDYQVISTRTPYNPGYGFDIQILPTTMHCDIATDSNWITTSADGAYTFASGTWYFISIVVTPTSWTDYVNGNQVGTGTYVTTTPIFTDSTHTVYIGMQSNQANPTNGYICDIQVYSRALSASEILADYNMNSQTQVNNTSGLYMWYQINENSGSTIADSSGNGLTGTVHGATWSGLTPFGSSGGTTNGGGNGTSAIAIPIIAGAAALVVLVALVVLLYVRRTRVATRSPIVGAGKVRSAGKITGAEETSSVLPRSGGVHVRRISAPVCPYCGARSKVADALFCWSCGANIEQGSDSVLVRYKGRRAVMSGKCVICNLDVKKNDEAVSCPHCGNIAHKTHMLEWLHVKGSCPICNERISEQDLGG